MRTYQLLLLTLVGACTLSLTAEGKELPDSTSLRAAFRAGKTEGSLRTFYMQTINHAGLRDYYALGGAAALRHETGNFHGFHFTIGGSYSYNLLSNDLTLPDPVTRTASRYEAGLFDLDHPTSKTDLARLEELQLRYQFRTLSLTWGMQRVQTPFLNAQDGRLRPNFADGIWLRVGRSEQIQAEAAWLYRIAPRSTTQWYTTGRSFGLYPSGLSVYGKPSTYRNAVQTDGLLIIALKGTSGKKVRWNLWDYFVPGVFHTVFGQAEYRTRHASGRDLSAGLQVTRQDAVGDGGNADSSKAYNLPGSGTWVVSGRIGTMRPDWQLWLNYTRIGKEGRFLMPREWGREPFYTFLPRERNEGAGDVHAISLQFTYGQEAATNRLSLSGGYYALPAANDALLNKYGMPSYIQINLEYRRHFRGTLEGLDLQVLLVHKFNRGDLFGKESYRFNKTDMSNLNLVLTYSF
jgi:hypothetical protein